MFRLLAFMVAIECCCLGIANCSTQDFVPTNSLMIAADTISTEIISAGTVRSEIECVTKCPLGRNCIAVRFNTTNGDCHVVLVYRVSALNLLGAPPGNLMGMNLSADSANKLWVSDNLTAWLTELSTVDPNATASASSTGRSGTIRTYTVPSTACYLIRAFGARGGTHRTVYDGSPSTTFPSKYWYGGLGAFQAGRFQLSIGTQLSIVVGQSGGNSTEMNPSYPTYPEDNAGTGGGGGSFVYRTSDNNLYLAAGGGGGGSNGYHGIAGRSEMNGSSSVGATASYSYPGGTNGDPGTTNPPGSSYHGGPGAGWNGKFATARAGTQHGDRGGGLSDGWLGGVSGGMNSGAVGGFGGGGGGSEDNGASGGGGGYSGGGAGTRQIQAGGGGGSFCAGVACEGITGGNTDSDHGLVSIQLYGSTCV